MTSCHLIDTSLLFLVNYQDLSLFLLYLNSFQTRTDTFYGICCKIIGNVLLHNVYQCLGCYFSYETLMATEQESLYYFNMFYFIKCGRNVKNGPLGHFAQALNI